MPPAPKLYLIHRQLTGKPVSKEEFVRRLKLFSRRAVIRLCSVLNMLLSKWEGDYDVEAHEKLVRTFFPAKTASAMIRSDRVAFHRHQLLYVAQEAMRYCNDEARDATGPYWGGFGVVLLMASELLYTPLPPGATASAELARKICQILPDTEANGLQSYNTKIARSIAIHTRFIEPFRNEANFFDIPALFEEAAGFPLETFQALLFGSVARFTKLSEIKQSQNPADFAVSELWFSKTTVPTEQITKFFEYVSHDSEDYAKAAEKNKPEANDFKIFRDKPLFKDSGNFYPIDLAILAEKFGSGPFWKVHGHIEAAKRDNLHNFWGTVFEAYIRWLLASSVDGKVNKFFPDPRYEGNPEQQVCDAIVVSGRCAVLIEVKGSTFTAAAKYGGDPKVLDAELTEKLVGTAVKRKGVHQLADAVERLCRQNSPEKIQGVDLYDITTVFPLILTRDDLGSAFQMNAYLNLHFQELVKHKKFLRSVTPLFCMSADDLEKFSPYLKDTSLANALSARYRSDKELAFSFWTTENLVLSRKGSRKPAVLAEETEKLVQISADRLGLK